MVDVCGLYNTPRIYALRWERLTLSSVVPDQLIYKQQQQPGFSVAITYPYQYIIAGIIHSSTF